MAWNLEIQVDKQFGDQVEEGWLRHVVERALTVENIEPPTELSLLITDDETVRELNRTYRGVDDTTDVLAFALREGADDASFPSSPDGIVRLGEVIISYPRTVSQSREHGHTPDDELALLIIHGVLHLLGYDHDEPEKERDMKNRESRILTSLRCA